MGCMPGLRSVNQTMTDYEPSDDDTFLEVDSDATRAHPEIVAQLFESIAEAYRKAPEECRYDFEVEITECDGETA